MNLIFLIPISIGSIFIIFTILIVIVSLTFKKTYGKRADGSISIRYPLPSDLNNIDITHAYMRSRNINLSYNVYKKQGTTPKALILVIHGIGSGHFYLLPMIEKFVNDGYMVFAYDQYASGCSEGKVFKTMSRGVIDVKYVLRFIENNNELNKYPLYVFGHSWGGYVAGCSLKYSKNIEKCVDVSGFNNECDFVRPIRLLVLIRNFLIVGPKAFTKVHNIFRKTKSKVYYLQGKQDSVVNPQFAGKLYEKIAKRNKNVVVEILENKGHTPFNDNHSQEEQNKVMGDFGTVGGILVPLERYADFRKISKVDDSVYQKILSFYEN